MGCCICCGGAGSDPACGGPCWDCRGTGCAHEDPCRAPIRRAGGEDWHFPVKISLPVE